LKKHPINRAEKTSTEFTHDVRQRSMGRWIAQIAIALSALGASVKAAPQLFTSVGTQNLGPDHNTSSFHTGTTGGVSSYLDQQAFYSFADGGPIFHGTGTASTNFGSLGCSTQVLLREYEALSYSGSTFMKSVAQFTDTLTIPGASSIQLTFHLSGVARDSDPTLIKSFISFSGNAADGGISLNSGALGFYPQGDFTTPVIPVTLGQPFNLQSQLRTEVDTSGAGPSGPVTAGIYYSNTARLTLIRAFDSNGAPLSNFTIGAASGASYPTSAVPVPPPKYVQAAGVFTSIPDGTGSFTSLPGAPGYSSSGQVAFYGTGSGGQQGIYSGIPGNPVRIADLNTAIPSGTGDFTSFIPQEPVRPSIDGSNVAFFGAGSGGQQGIYAGIPGNPVRIADTATAIPGGMGNFTSFIPQGSCNPAISGNNVAFFGAGSGGQQGIYSGVPGNPVRVADTGTAIPGGTGNFTAFPSSPSISGNNVAFLGSGSGGQQGIYAGIPGNPIRVADLNTAIPGGTGNFTSFIPGNPVAPAIDGNNVAFFGAGSGGQQGIYAGIPGNPVRIADTATAIPGGTGNFTGFGDVSLSATDVAFFAMGASGQQGIYDMTGGALVKVIDLTDLVDGRPIAGLSFSRSGLSGDPLAFQATFVDGSQGIYTWSQPGITGDFNHNGVVDAADYVSWRKGLGTTYTQSDYDVWRAHFGQSAGAGATAASSSAAVPEPAMFQLLLLAIACVLLRAMRLARSHSHETGRHADGQTRRIVTKRLSLSPCLLVSSCFMIVVGVQAQWLHAQTYWTAGTADWNSSANWSAGLPNSLTVAYVNNGGTPRVLAAGAVAEGATLGDGANDIGSLEISGGALDLPQPQAGTITVGNFGGGTFSIKSGGKLTTRFSRLGVYQNSTGTATVTGANSSWSTSEGFRVGDSGYGWLAIENAGAVSYTYAAVPAYLGLDATGAGTIVVDGTSSNFTSSGDLFVGNSGIGWLYVQNGGKATNFNGDLAVNSGSFGTVSVDGTGSKWTNNSVIAVGVSGTAELSVSGGGAVTSTNGRIGREVGSNGTTTVTGAGSSWTASGDVSIGNAGTGALNISDGAKVSNFNGNIGVLAGSYGVVTVSGPGSLWQNNSVVAVGAAGDGQLNVLNGANVSSTNGRVGRELNSSGNVTIDGTQSWWSCTGALTIGLGGTGTGNVSVTNGGFLSASGGMTIGPLGTVTGDASIFAAVTNGGLVGPGNSLGTLFVSGSFAQTTGGTLQIELASSTNYDKLHVYGGITFGGTLEVGFVGGYIPRGGSYSFDILDWTGAPAGLFSNIYLSTADGTLTWDTSQLYTTGVLTVTSTGSPDDFNGDGVVDAGDFVMWRKGLGVNFNEADYDVWRANFGAGAGSGAAAHAAVPEPRTLVMLMIVLAWPMRLRRLMG
jgi:T5SS/PEP-CTERM-associated repeat protein